MNAGDLYTKARELDLELLASVPVRQITEDPISSWINNGYHGSMEWIPRSKEKRLDPTRVLPNAKSIITVALNYYQGDFPEEIQQDKTRGLIARYAWFPEYHTTLLKKLTGLSEYLQHESNGTIQTKAYVDTGPILERYWAARAGMGFIGKNTNLIYWQFGSYFFLGEILLDTELPEFQQNAIGSCGTCTRCIDSCPTNAIIAPQKLDARRCISYLTIEHRGSIPESLRPAMGNRIFGCDICQEVCPWNSKAKKGKNAKEPNWDLWAPKLGEALLFSKDEFTTRYRHSPVLRAKYEGFIRNVAIAIGNSQDANLLPLLHAARLKHSDEVVREHIDWAISRIDT